MRVNFQEFSNNQYPRVSFRLNQGLDIDVGTTFIDSRKAGVDFGKEIIKDHPDLAVVLLLSGDARKKAIGDYVKNFYRIHKKELKTTLTKFQSEWDEVQPDFFDKTDKIFDGHRWPHGAYNGFLTIFRGGQRDLDAKTFHAYIWNRDGSINAAAHELLHFIFYDFLEKSDSDDIKSIGEERIWKLSEVFNDLVFGQPEYERFRSKTPGSGSYPELLPMGNNFRKKLKSKSFTIKTFIEEAKKLV